jgi:hypothetical protein
VFFNDFPGMIVRLAEGHPDIVVLWEEKQNNQVV